MTEQVSGPLPSGVYTVGWRVVATDGHPVSGQYRFIVGGGTSAAPGAGPVAGPGGSAASRTATAGTGSSGTCWWWAGLGALLLAGVGAGVVFARRTLWHDGRP